MHLRVCEREYMAYYIIGDVHGCYYELKNLLKLIKFNQVTDHVIFVGDLVGRGPKSLEVLDLIMDLGDSAISVLGNYDLKLLAVYYNIVTQDPIDKFDSILQNTNINKYISWYSNLDFLYLSKRLNIAVAHAGIPPNWGIDSEAYEHAKFAKDYINTHGMKNALINLYSNNELDGTKLTNDHKLFQYIVFGFTRLRYCLSDNYFDKDYKGKPGTQPNNLLPWFSIREKSKNDGYSLFFGHWASLGLNMDNIATCCDSGCIWGGSLTALKIDKDIKLYKVASAYNANEV